MLSSRLACLTTSKKLRAAWSPRRRSIQVTVEIRRVAPEFAQPYSQSRRRATPGAVPIEGRRSGQYQVAYSIRDAGRRHRLSAQGQYTPTRTRCPACTIMRRGQQRRATTGRRGTGSEALVGWRQLPPRVMESLRSLWAASYCFPVCPSVLTFATDRNGWHLTSIQVMKRNFRKAIDPNRHNG